MVGGEGQLWRCSGNRSGVPSWESLSKKKAVTGMVIVRRLLIKDGINCLELCTMTSRSTFDVTAPFQVGGPDKQHKESPNESDCFDWKQQFQDTSSRSWRPIRSQVKSRWIMSRAF